MAWTPPINRRENKNLLNDKRFYRLLSQECKYLDEDTALVFYATLVQVVASELKRHKVVRLPHLGDFGLVKQKARPGWVGKSHIFMDEKEVLRFYPKERFKRYFSKRTELK